MKTIAPLALIFLGVLLVTLVSSKDANKTDIQITETELNSQDAELVSKHGAIIGSFISTSVSEFGDRTFILTAMLSTKYSKKWVFLGCFGAFFVMNTISCTLGNVSQLFLSKQYLKYGAALLFLFFGGKSLYEAITNTVDDEDDEAEEHLKKIEKKLATKKEKSIVHITGAAIAVTTFLQNFFGEWGDSSQLSTIAMSASFQFWKVLLGSTAAQTFTTLLALAGGQMMAKKFSERTMAYVSGSLFILYGIGTFTSA